MSLSPPKSGRPKRATVDALEITLAKNYQSYLTLGEEFIRHIDSRYPAFDDEQKTSLKHRIFGYSEEHRLWADFDNLLLSVQRHPSPTERFSTVADSIFVTIVQLESIYTIVLKSAQPTELNKTPSETRPLISALTSSPSQQKLISVWITNELHKETLPQQAEWLLDVCEHFKLTLLSRETSPDAFVECIKQSRAILRALMLSLSKYKIEPMYKPNVSRQVGRPPVPLPTQLVRAEEALLNTYRSYRIACQKLHRKTLTSQQVWQNHQEKIESKMLGRKSSTPLQVLVNQSLSQKTELYCLSIDKEHIIANLKLKIENRTNTKGRPALTYGQRKNKIEAKIRNIDAQLLSLKNEYSPNANFGKCFDKQVQEYKLSWLKSKIKRSYALQASSNPKFSSACHQYWEDLVSQIKHNKR